MEILHSLSNHSVNLQAFTSRLCLSLCFIPQPMSLKVLRRERDLLNLHIGTDVHAHMPLKDCGSSYIPFFNKISGVMFF